MVEIGLVGAPSSGKSTFFKAITLKDVKIASYPFTTIEPNEGTAFITTKCPHTEIGVKCNPRNAPCINGTRFIPIKVWDVAGLVSGAHEGRGRGNSFLDDVMRSRGLIHILDISGRTNSDGEPAEGFDPYETVRMLDNELDYWMLGILKREMQKFKSTKVDYDALMKSLENRFSGLGITLKSIEKALESSSLNVSIQPSLWQDYDMLDFISKLRKISKPMIIAANKIDVPGAEDNLKRLRERTDYEIIPCSAEIELALREASSKGLIEYIPGEREFKIISNELSERQKKAFDFIQNFLDKWNTTGVQQILNKMIFEKLKMKVVYPVEDEAHFSDKKGNVLPDAFLLEEDGTAIDLAYAIHQDIGKNFIAAIDARTKKRISSDQVLKNGDIISIRARK